MTASLSTIKITREEGAVVDSGLNINYGEHATNLFVNVERGYRVA